jgi:hypothetical protein
VLFGVQVLINLSVTMAIMPTKGLTLPFVSYGGSSLLVNAAAMGILLNISRSRASARNTRVADGPMPEASALLVTEADFAPVNRARRKKQRAASDLVGAELKLDQPALAGGGESEAE